MSGFAQTSRGQMIDATKERHTFAFEGGEYLSTIGATFFVSY